MIKKIVNDRKYHKAEKNIRIYNPLEGSLAKVWTELRIPDLTKNVPVTLKVNVDKHKIITQGYK